MEDMEMCRICTNYVNESNATNLFEKYQRNLLTQIKNITGQLLRNEKDLPKHICPACEENLKRAHSFRKRCLDSQSYFHSVKYKLHVQRKTHNFIENEKECDSNDNGEAEVLVIIKEEEEQDLIDSNFVDNIEFDRKEKNDPLKRKSLSQDSNCSPDPAIGTNQNENISVSLQKICNTENENTNKEIKRTHTKLRRSNISAGKKWSSLKDKKPEEKVDFICDQCGNYFTCRHHFLTHLRRHTNDKPFKCEICPDKFYTHSELKRHMRRHTGERPFSCQYCQRRFTDYSTRIKHERTHTNERPYSCNQCGKAFTTSYVLKNHMLIHTGERSFKCSLCNKAFQRQTHLTTHFRSIMHKQMLEKLENEQDASLTQESESLNSLIQNPMQVAAKIEGIVKASSPGNNYKN